MKRLAGLFALACLAAGITFVFVPTASALQRLNCSEPEANALCAEVADSIGYASEYTGHDEPSLLFYSNTPGSGNSSLYHLQIPTDPKKQPTQDGTGAT